MPRFGKIDLSIIKAAGFRYDSSINPTLIPGRYNNLFSQRNIYLDINSNLIEIPVSVSPLIRFPLFWLSFKNLPLFIYQYFCNSVLRKDQFLHLYFHPWEFARIGQFNIPGYIKRPDGDRYTSKFERLLYYLERKGEFVTVSEFLGNYQF